MKAAGIPRSKCQRQIAGLPVSTCFNPRGIPLADLEEVVLTIDEVEAIRLADFKGLYQEQAAEKMQIARQTFGRVISSAHHKISEATEFYPSPGQLTTTVVHARKCRPRLVELAVLTLARPAAVGRWIRCQNLLQDEGGDSKEVRRS